MSSGKPGSAGISAVPPIVSDTKDSSSGASSVQADPEPGCDPAMLTPALNLAVYRTWWTIS